MREQEKQLRRLIREQIQVMMVYNPLTMKPYVANDQMIIYEMQSIVKDIEKLTVDYISCQQELRRLNEVNFKQAFAAIKGHMTQIALTVFTKATRFFSTLNNIFQHISIKSYMTMIDLMKKLMMAIMKYKKENPILYNVIKIATICFVGLIVLALISSPVYAQGVPKTGKKSMVLDYAMSFLDMVMKDQSSASGPGGVDKVFENLSNGKLMKIQKAIQFLIDAQNQGIDPAQLAQHAQKSGVDKQILQVAQASIQDIIKIHADAKAGDPASADLFVAIHDNIAAVYKTTYGIAGQ